MSNVLIVDDSCTMRKIIARSLRQAGYSFAEILEAADGYEALDTLTTRSVDLVLADINMPNMDGLEFLKQKLRQDAIKDIPVFMITADLGSEILAETMELGAKGCIKKPFTPEQINDVLDSYI